MHDEDSPPPAEREVPLDEAMSIAVLLQKNGQLQDAETLYARILDVAPDHPDALHFAGLLAHQQGRSADAVSLIERSLQIVPDRADCYSNLGIVFRAMKRPDDAIAAYRRALALDPQHANALNNLGVLLREQKKLTEAEEAFREAIRVNPEHIDAYTNLASLLAATKRTKEAVACYCKVTVLSPRHPDARRLLALAYCTLGETQKAVDIFKGWLAEEPENVVARHMLAACSGEEVPARASDAYVEKVFDDFASSFEKKLAQLAYRAPNLVGAMLADSGLTPSRMLDVLDAGCGTGLCGPLLAPYARTLTGVDLSARMLAVAEEKKVYDALVKEELTAFLRSHPAAYDVIVSADTLVYFGSLEEVAAAAAAALRPGGLLIFTLEEAGDDPAGGMRINAHGRYSHGRDYVQQVLVQAGFDVTIVRAELRMEGGAPVAGLVVQGSRRSSAHPARGVSGLAAIRGGTHG